MPFDEDELACECIEEFIDGERVPLWKLVLLTLLFLT